MSISESQCSGRRPAIAVVLVTIAILGLLPVSIALASPLRAPAAGFTDVPGDHPYRAAIADLADRHVTSGFQDGTYRPDDSISREQFAKLIVRALRLPVSDDNICAFTDVPTSTQSSRLDPSDPTILITMWL